MAFMSPTNPFAPPSNPEQFQAAPGDVKYSGIGVYCDQDLLVISRAKHQLPSLCLKTGEPTDGRFIIHEKFLPKSSTFVVGAAFGAIGYAIWKAIFGTMLHLELPFTPGWINPKDPSPERSKRGRAIVFAGFGILLAGIILSAFSEYFIGLAAVGMFVAFGGLIASGFKSSKKPFAVSRFDEQFIWVSGVTKSIAYQFEPFSNVQRNSK